MSSLNNMLSQQAFPRSMINDLLDLQIATKVFGFHKKVGPEDLWEDGQRREYHQIPQYSSCWEGGELVLAAIRDFKLPIEISYDDNVQPIMWIVTIDGKTAKDVSLEKCLCEGLLAVF